MEDIKTKLRDLIENNKIEEAIKLLKTESAKKGGQLDHIIISLSSRYKRYKKDSLMGLEARDQEFSKIVSDSLELVKALDDPYNFVSPEPKSSGQSHQSSYSKPSAPSSGKSNKYVQMGIGGLAVIGLITLIAILVGGGEDTGYDDPNAVYDDPSFVSDDPNAAYDDPNAVYDDPNAGYTDPNAGGGETEYPLYDVSGHWRQVSQSFGPESDCPDCTVDITQNGSSISIASNSGLYAELEYLSQYGLFEGRLNWGNNEPDEAAQLYFDDNGYMVIGTMIQGAEYYMYFAQ